MHFLVYVSQIVSVQLYTKYFKTLRPIERNSLKSVLTWLMCVKFKETYTRYLIAQ